MEFYELDYDDDLDTLTLSEAFLLKLITINDRILPRKFMHLKKETDLQTMCLNVIADNIKRFAKVCPRWDDLENCKHTHIDFLRRMYTDRVYGMIKDRDVVVSSRIVDFILTPSWKKVTFSRFEHNHEGLFRRLKSMGKMITSLTLQDSTASPDMLTAIICCVPNIAFLNLVATECNDSVLALISKTCKSLVTLNLGECSKVTDAGMAHLYNLDSKEIGLASLKALNISATQVSERSLPFLLKYIKSLEYFKYNIVSIVLYDLYVNHTISGAERYNLTSFEFTKADVFTYLPRYEDVDAKRLLEVWSLLCPHVTRICVRERVDDKFLEMCSGFENLKVAKLINEYNLIRLTPTPFFRLRASQLTELHVKTVSISVAVVVEVCTNLKKLILDNVVFEDCEVPLASSESNKLTNLEFITLNKVSLENIANKSLQILLQVSKNLTTLGITYCSNFQDDLLVSILNCQNLNTLSLSFTDISPEMLLLLLTSENLQSICIDGCPRIPRKSESFLETVNDNPRGNTCGWKINYGYFADFDVSMWSDRPWAEELSI